MKRVLYIFFLLSAVVDSFSQTAITDSIHPLFKGNLDGDTIREAFDYLENKSSVNRNPGIKDEIILAIFHSKNLYPITVLNNKEKIQELDNFATGRANEYSFTKGALGTQIVPLFDSSAIIVTAYGITPETKKDFEFRVVLNKTKTLVPWTGIKFFSPVYMHFHFSAAGKEYKEMAYIGSFNASFGNGITIEVRKRKAPETTSIISAIWIKKAPAVIATFTTSQMKEFFEVYKYQWKYDFNIPQLSYYGDLKTKPVDSILSLQTEFESNKNDIFFYLKGKVKAAGMVEYNLVHDDSVGWKANTFDPNIIWLKNLSPGRYKLLLRYAFQRQTISTYSFTINPAWYQTIWFKIIAGLLSVLALMSVWLLVKNRLQKLKLKQQAIQKQMAQAEMKSIKSQFNPHFVFNALTSIQGLITKNDIEGAHHYLNDFSRLLRNSLSQSEKEFINLSKDIELTENYLKLEQLRFGFEFTISVCETLNKEAVEVPVLLLQPVIENAVKHGIAHLYKNGRLAITYEAAGADLVITIEDNGHGFTTANKRGYGIKLTDERVGLLNKTLDSQSICWQTERAGMGTQVRFTFKNWLL